MNLADKLHHFTALRVLQKMTAMQSVFILIHFLAMSTQAYKVETVYLDPDGMQTKVCSKTIPVTDSTAKYDIRVGSDQCQRCQNESRLCVREKKQSCYITFQPSSTFIRLTMRLCSDMSGLNVTMCGNRVETWTYKAKKDCNRRPAISHKCKDFDRNLRLLYKGYNFCAFQGPVFINLDLFFISLSTSVLKKSDEATGVLSYLTFLMLCRDTPDFVCSPQTLQGFYNKRICIKFLHAHFCCRNPAIVLTAVGSSLFWRFDHQLKPSLDLSYCRRLRSIGMNVKTIWPGSLHSSSQVPPAHEVVFEYTYKSYSDEDKDRDESKNQSDDDKESGLEPAWIVLISICSLFGTICCYCCVRCQLKNTCKDVDSADDNENEPFDADRATDLELNRQAADVTIVHDVVRGRMEALGPRTTATPPGSGSRSGSPHHIPTSQSHSSNPSPFFHQDEAAESPQPSAPAAEPPTMPPPSYESLFPAAR